MKNTLKKMLVALGVATLLAGCGLTPVIDHSTTNYIDNVYIGQELYEFEQLPQEEKDRVIAMITEQYKLDATLLPVSAAMNKLDPLEIFFRDVTSKQAEEAYGFKWSETKVKDVCKVTEGIVTDPIPPMRNTYDRKVIDNKVFPGKYGYATFSFVRYFHGIGPRKEGQVYTYIMTTPGFIQLAKDDFQAAVNCRDNQISYYYPRFKDARTPIEEASLNAIKLHWNYISDIDAILKREAKLQNKVFSPKVNVVHAVRALPMPKAENKPSKSTKNTTPNKSSDDIGLDTDIATDDELGFNTGSITGI